MRRNLLLPAVLLLVLVAGSRPSGANDPVPPAPSKIEEPPARPKNIIWFRGKWIDMDDLGSPRGKQKQRQGRAIHPQRARPAGAGPARPLNPADLYKTWPKPKPEEIPHIDPKPRWKPTIS
jgi:hypothetical protein